jgi:hypothetical protein
MARNFTTALIAALALGSAGIASARAPSIEHYDGWTYPQSEEPYCYLPSWPCEQPHRVTKSDSLASSLGGFDEKRSEEKHRRTGSLWKSNSQKACR